MKREKCPLCESSNTVEAYKLNYGDMWYGLGGVDRYKQEIRYCKECGMIWADNPIPDKQLKKYYKYLSKYEARNKIGQQDSSQTMMFRRQFEFINGITDDYDSVLEIGAATGENLSLYSSIGKRVLGIEPSENNKVYAKEKYGIDLIPKTFNDWYRDASDDIFDLIFMSHSLEHIVDFMELVLNMEKFKPKFFFIEVPSTDQMIDRVEPFGVFTPEHVNYFTENTLRKLMTICGYIEMKSIIELNDNGVKPGFPTLCTLWKREPSNDVNSLEIRYDAEKFLDSYYENSKKSFMRIESIISNISDKKRIAVWGTGAHTARLLGMTELLKKNVIKFYDSDPKKEGMFMNGLPITRFNVSDIEENKINTILISSFSSERTIKKSIDEAKVEVDVITLYS